MAGVTIISGCPGSGKTTLSARLAAMHSRGVHLLTDEFYRFVAHLVDPSSPESRDQNGAIVRSFLQAARSFAEDGYDVYVDGVIGPWWLDEVRRYCPDYRYVLLHVDLDTALSRTKARPQQPSASARVVRTMHAQFAAISGLDAWRLNTANRTPDAILAEYLQRREAGGFGPVASVLPHR